MSACLEMRLPIRREGFVLDVDLGLPGQGVSVVSGPSGSGKTSLLRALAGLDRHEGAFLRLGDAVWQDGTEFIPAHRRPIGYVFQEARLFPHLTVRGNIDYGRKRSGGRWPGDAIALLGLEELLERRPASLSGGERQRVAVARALAAAPEILLMDEPLSSLDAARKAGVLPYLAAVHETLSIPVVYVTHSAGEAARLGDHLVLLGGGRVLADGPLAEMLTRLDLPPATGRDAAAVIGTTVAGTDDRFGLARLVFDGGELSVVDGGFELGEHVRVHVAARDVSLAREAPAGSSILNVFPATIDSLCEAGPAETVVRLRAGNTCLLARVTRKSVHALGLAPGVGIVAQVKSVAVLH